MCVVRRFNFRFFYFFIFSSNGGDSDNIKKHHGGGVGVVQVVQSKKQIYKIKTFTPYHQQLDILISVKQWFYNSKGNLAAGVMM